jgi:hypothetical protein
MRQRGEDEGVMAAACGEKRGGGEEMRRLLWCLHEEVRRRLYGCGLLHVSMPFK